MTAREELAQYAAGAKSLGQLCREYEKHTATVHLEELVGGALSFYAAAAVARVGGIHLFVAEDRDAAAYLLNDFYNLLDETRVCFFPSAYKRSAAYGAEDAQGVVQRTATMRAVRTFGGAKGDYLVVCTYPEALAERVADAEVMRRGTIPVRVGDRISIEVLEGALVDAGFTRVDFVYEPGQYSVRGGIVDVFSYSESKPYRLDFFGDEVDSIRRFNISSQLSADRLDGVEIIPDLNGSRNDAAARVSLVRFAGAELACWFYDADYVLRRVNDVRRRTLQDMEQPETIDELMTSRNGLLADMAACRLFLLRDNLAERPAAATIRFSTAPQPKFNKNFEMLADDMIRNSLRGYGTRILSENKLTYDYIAPKIPYRETITKVAQADYRHKKQSGGAGQFGEVHMIVEPYYEGMPEPKNYKVPGKGDMVVNVKSKEEYDLPWGGKLQFYSAIVGGAIDARFMPAILKGIMEKMDEGPLTGSYARDIRVVVYDGKMHPVDSNEISFKLAARNAFKEAFRNAGPKIMEPIYSVEILVPSEYMGAVMSDLQNRRAMIAGMESDKGFDRLNAMVPLAELYRYSTTLSSLTSGSATYSMKFSSYEQVPADVQEKLLKAYTDTDDE